MKKIGIIICALYRDCAGGKCFRALRERRGGFSIYPAESPVEIVGYSSCGGCPGGNVEYVPEEMKKNGAEEAHCKMPFWEQSAMRELAGQPAGRGTRNQGSLQLRGWTRRKIRLLLPTFTIMTVPYFASPQAVSPAADTIPLVTINAARDSFTMGDGVNGLNVSKTISCNYATQSYWTTSGWAWIGNRTQPAFWADSNFNGPSQPVVGVRWYEAVAYCNWLSVKEGFIPAHDGFGHADLSAAGYRLPTEVQWEYAAAKGAPGHTERMYPWGKTWDSRKATCRVSPASASKTADVGSKSPEGDSPPGLSDMSGNVWQWCSDNAQSDARLARSPLSDRYFFQSDSLGSYFVLRGGSWCNNFMNGFRASFRGYFSAPGVSYNIIGFRVVRR
jgi:hypothetical protein